MTTPFFQRMILLIRCIPKGKVSCYGLIAQLAGDPRGARSVSRFIYSSTKKYNLPWWRVINSRGKISIPLGGGISDRNFC